MTLSSASSQQLLTTTDSTVLVPVRALKNAMLMKVSYDNCRNELEVARDSIRLQDSIIIDQESTIFNLVSQVDVFKANEQNYEEVMGYKDSIIEIKNKEIEHYKGSAKAAWLITGLNTIVFLILLI